LLGAGALIGGAIGLQHVTGSEASRYFVSNVGDDAKTGLSPSEAWQTLNRVNAALNDGTVKPGESVLLHRGHQFFGSIKAQPPKALAASQTSITIAAYGHGAPPQISGYKIVDNKEAWQEVQVNVWRADLTDGRSYSGNTSSADTNVGFIRVDGVMYGSKKATLDQLTAQWDFVTDSRYLYVRSTAAPTDLARDFRAAVDGILIEGFSGLTVRDLDLIGSGGHGYQQRAATNTRVTHCLIHEIGGSLLGGTGATRYGNGVELWMGSSDSTISDNRIFDVYDVACTVQGWQQGTFRSIEDCSFRRNLIYNCTQAFEYWVRGADASAGTGLVLCSFVDNVCVGGGYSCSYAVRPDRYGKGDFVLVHDQELPTDITVEDNVFFDARDCYLFVTANGARLRDGANFDRNVIALRVGTVVQAGKPFTIENATLWANATGQELSSHWSVVPPSIETGEQAVAFVEKNRAALRGLRPPRR
jgi:hypothetical protein